MAQGNHPEGGDTWRDVVRIVRALYPDLLTRTYVVPPVHFNKVPYERRNVPGVNLSSLMISSPSGNHPPKHDPLPTSSPDVPPIPQSLWTQDTQKPVRVQENDFRDDFAQNHVMCNLEALGNSRKEVMFILSRFNFANYLNQPAYAAAAAHHPRPSQLDTAEKTYSNCEADLMLIHRDHGILIGKIKSVGRNKAGNKKETMTKRIRQAAKQLDSSATVVRHILRDEAPDLSVSKTVFLPYVSRSQLREVLTGDPLLAKELCTSLGAKNAMEASQLCCCSDDLSDPDAYWDAKGTVLSRLETWWHHRMTPSVRPKLTNEQYIEIVARFVGPATTVEVHCNISPRVEVRTKGQAAAELGWRLARLILTLQQLNLLNKNPRLVRITGPPGTGKTIMLVLQALRWLLQGHDVHIVSTSSSSLAVSKMMQHQLEVTTGANTKRPGSPSGKVILHNYDFANVREDVNKAVTELFQLSQNQNLCVILDEAAFSTSLPTGPRNQHFTTLLVERVPEVHFWTAGYHNREQEIPQQFEQHIFTVPLRNAPVVLREVQRATDRFHINDYSDSGTPAPGDGPHVTRRIHYGNGHGGHWPVECWQCGQDVAAVLQRLGVGIENKNQGNSFTYRDVFILTRSSELKDALKNGPNDVVSPACGFVRGLRDAQLPVCVLGSQVFREGYSEWERKITDVAVAASNKVTVATWQEVNGLERRIVVNLQGRDKDNDESKSSEEIDAQDRLGAISRCTTQLIKVRASPLLAATGSSTPQQ